MSRMTLGFVRVKSRPPGDAAKAARLTFTKELASDIGEAVLMIAMIADKHYGSDEKKFDFHSYYERVRSTADTIIDVLWLLAPTRTEALEEIKARLRLIGWEYCKNILNDDAALPLTGTKCSVCGAPQFETPSSGVSCSNGHGGAPPAGEL